MYFPGWQDIMKDAGQGLKGSEWDVGLGEIEAGAIEGGAAGAIAYKGTEIIDAINDIANGKQDHSVDIGIGIFPPPGKQNIPTGPIGRMGPIDFPQPPGKPSNLGPGNNKDKSPHETDTLPSDDVDLPTKQDGTGGKQQGAGSSSGGGTRTQGTQTDGKQTSTKQPETDPPGGGSKTQEGTQDKTKEKEKQKPKTDSPEGWKDNFDAETTGSSTAVGVKKIKNLSILQILKKIDKNQIQQYDIFDEEYAKESNKADVIVAEQVKNETRESRKEARADDYVKYHAYNNNDKKYIIKSELELEKINLALMSHHKYDLPDLQNRELVFKEVTYEEDNKVEQYERTPLKAVFKREILI